MRQALCVCAALLVLQAARAEGPLALQSDFGTRHLNGLGNVALTLNRGSLAARHGIASGARWTIEVARESAK